MKRADWMLVLLTCGVIALFVAMVAAMWRLGFFVFTGSDATSKVVVAALALVGAFATGMISIVGILLKYSIDAQTESRQLQEADRAAAQLKESEKRLGLEAATRVLQLLSTSAGGPVQAIQRDGALFALMSLGQYDLALSLTSILFMRGDLSSHSASQLLQLVLVQTKDEAIKLDAISLLYANTHLMITDEDFDLPRALTDWNVPLPDYVREFGALSIVKLIMEQPIDYWKARLPKANFLVAALALAWLKEKDLRLKNDCGALLCVVLAAFPGIAGVMFHPQTNIDIDEIRAQTDGLTAVSSGLIELIRLFADWAAKPPAPAQPPKPPPEVLID